MSDKTHELRARLAELANTLITDPDLIDDFCRQWSNGFHNYSLGNTLLIWFQRPGATLCAGYHDWLKKHHRYVKKGEKGIAILAPILKRVNGTGEDGEEVEEVRRYFRTVYVFDVSQTDGEPLSDMGHSDKVTGWTVLDLEQTASLFPYPLTYRDDIIENGSTDGKTIMIANRTNPFSMVATYFHELAHCILDHPGQLEHHDRCTIELEAEAVSYIVSSYYGLQNDRSRYYISNWKGTREKLEHAGSRVIRTADHIIKTIEKGGDNAES